MTGKPEVKGNVTLICMSSSGKPIPLYKWKKTSPTSEVFFSPMLSECTAKKQRVIVCYKCDRKSSLHTVFWDCHLAHLWELLYMWNNVSSCVFDCLFHVNCCFRWEDWHSEAEQPEQQHVGEIRVHSQQHGGRKDLRNRPAHYQLYAASVTLVMVY